MDYGRTLIRQTPHRSHTSGSQQPSRTHSNPSSYSLRRKHRLSFGWHLLSSEQSLSRLQTVQRNHLPLSQVRSQLHPCDQQQTWRFLQSARPCHLNGTNMPSDRLLPQHQHTSYRSAFWYPWSFQQRLPLPYFLQMDRSHILQALL